MKKPIFIGAVGCGKTTLCQRLLKQAVKYRKTQVVQFYQHNQLIDTPGEFMEHRQYYSALTITAVDADVVVLLQSATDRRQTFSPGFGSMFPKRKIGVITKIDLVSKESDIKRARRQLVLAGAKTIFEVSLTDNSGLDKLADFLEMNLDDEQSASIN